MSFAPSKLFHAVVISGAALTGCASTGQKTQAPTEPKTATPTEATQAGGTCPPGSERPFPPCFWIK
ncbi:MAG: hypothetical protein H7138_19480 [Myxococcales bacterium]|nr:hypothetical protein [Myxococcales bacterium]